MARKSKKNKKAKTIGEMTNSRGLWEMNPITRIKQSERKKNDRREAKDRIRKGDFDD